MTEMVTVKIAEDWKSSVTFWLALTTTTCALVIATVDATNFLRAQEPPKSPVAVSR
ncbi:hypothetical protein [Micromonospora tulbaghiae]|uniref:hypothetical protein n=1 Tax=Micromonospora tulbaghiae TaxID=479978 RepID=UPI003441110E